MYSKQYILTLYKGVRGTQTSLVFVNVTSQFKCMRICGKNINNLLIINRHICKQMYHRSCEIMVLDILYAQALIKKQNTHLKRLEQKTSPRI